MLKRRPLRDFGVNRTPIEMPVLNEFTLFGSITLISILRYAIFASIAWMLCYVCFSRRWHHRKIVQRLPLSKDIRREVLHSLRSILIFGLIGILTIKASRVGWTHLYLDIHAHSWSWFLASIVLTILVHDTWFYWTHRLMHHLSTNPTPWAAFAFSPAEAVIQAAIFPIAVTIMPVHPYAFGIFLAWQMLFNVIGHTGYEFHPGWLMRSPLRFVMNTPTNHAMHHESMHGNFGLYFNYWDRLMRTNHQDYERRFLEVTSRKTSG